MADAGQFVSDFLLDFRPPQSRRLDRAAERLRFVEDTVVHVFDHAGFGLVITHTGDETLWAPYVSETGAIVAVAGRTAFDDSEWDTGVAVSGAGGLAAKVIYARYRGLGLPALERLNGNCAVLVYDETRQCVHLVTDCCGVLPVFEVATPGPPMYGSHPDVLADAANENHRFDELSLSEFVLAGTVTPPFSYYERIRAADHGVILTVDVSGGEPARAVKRRHFDISYRGDASVSEDEFARQIAAGLQRAVSRRTQPRLGRSAVALSGGLDSRAILACTPDKERTFAFSIYDEPNQEFRTAEQIARSLAVRLLPLRRTPDYYADHAELGVRISGGMGSFANNHFLGVIPRLKAEGMENLLTGCYCDYLFKGLPLNRRSHWLTRREKLAPFQHQFYFDHFPSSTALARRARERWEARLPRELRKQDTAAEAFQVEARRTFPLWHEGDNQQRLVPQRVTGWCPPFVDRELVDLFCRLPYHFKLNRSVFRKVVLALAPELRGIPDANTRACVDASPGCEWIRHWQTRLQSRWRRLYTPAASENSWRNWSHYILHSPRLDALWNRPNADAMDLFRRILGPEGMPEDAALLKRRQPYLFLSLLTQKLWLDQRT